MEKFMKAIDLADHPGKYSSEEIRELLEDEEIKELYNAICDSDSALNLPSRLSEEEVEREWERFNQSEREASRKGSHLADYFSRRAAVIATVITVSLVAMAIGGAMLVHHNSAQIEKQSLEATAMVPAMSATVVAASDTVAQGETIDNFETDAEVKLFENEPLSNILDEMSRHYGFKVRILNGGVAGLRLYFRWDPSDELPEVIRQLNNFERINLVLNGDTLTVK